MRNDLRDARKSRNLSQAKLAKLIGKDQAYVSRVETGDYRVDPDVAPMMAKALKMPLLKVLYPA